MEARMVPEARSLRLPVLKPGNSKATGVRHVAGPDLSTDPIFPTIVMALADKSRPNHLNGERDFISEDLAPLFWMPIDYSKALASARPENFRSSS